MKQLTIFLQAIGGGTDFVTNFGGSADFLAANEKHFICKGKYRPVPTPLKMCQAN